VNPSLLQHGPTMLPSEGIVEDKIFHEAVAVSGAEGEILILQEKVSRYSEKKFSSKKHQKHYQHDILQS